LLMKKGIHVVMAPSGVCLQNHMVFHIDRLYHVKGNVKICFLRLHFQPRMLLMARSGWNLCLWY